MRATRPAIGAHDPVGVSLPPGRVDREAVVVARDLDHAGLEVLDRLVHASVAERHLERAAAERDAEQLMTQADAEDRDRAEKLPHSLDAVRRRGRIARSVREEHPVVAAGRDLRPKGSRPGRRSPRCRSPTGDAGCCASSRSRRRPRGTRARDRRSPRPTRVAASYGAATLTVRARSAPCMPGVERTRSSSDAASRSVVDTAARIDPRSRSTPREPPGVDALDAPDARSLRATPGGWSRLAMTTHGAMPLAPRTRPPGSRRTPDRRGSCRSCPDAARS